MTFDDISALFQHIGLSPFSRHFAAFIGRLDDWKNPTVYLSAGLVCHQVEQGDICLRLDIYVGRIVHLNQNELEIKLRYPSREQWLEALTNSPLVSLDGKRAPFILSSVSNQPCLYLLKYWKYEQVIIQYLSKQISSPRNDLDIEKLELSLDRLFSKSSTKPDWQREAARIALTYPFTVITGGPGTGKTTTVVKIIEALIQQTPERIPSIALTAPTGKAAARLNDSLRNASDALSLILESGRIFLETATIHRLLGNQRGTPYFKHNKDHSLPFDIIIVDEASMVDVALMAKLIQALKPDASLILLGDQYQLSSVEAGALFGDICGDFNGGTGSVSSGLDRHIARLKVSYRFDSDKGIGALSESINRGNGSDCLTLAQNDHSGAVEWRSSAGVGTLRQWLNEMVLPMAEALLSGNSISAAFALFEKSMVLCAVRRGPFGVSAVNRVIQEKLREKQLIPRQDDPYHGQPIMITQNHYELGLFNGDIGILFRDEADQQKLKVFFKTADGNYRTISPSRLPPYDTVYAMTVHKSQGSEFDRVMLVLPDKTSLVLTRELLYTGVTRARKSVVIFGTEDAFLTAVNRQTDRHSLIRWLFWEKTA